MLSSQDAVLNISSFIESFLEEETTGDNNRSTATTGSEDVDIQQAQTAPDSPNQASPATQEIPGANPTKPGSPATVLSDSQIVNSADQNSQIIPELDQNSEIIPELESDEIPQSESSVIEDVQREVGNVLARLPKSNEDEASLVVPAPSLEDPPPFVLQSRMPELVSQNVREREISQMNTISALVIFLS